MYAIVWRRFRDGVFSRFTMLAQTDGRTDNVITSSSHQTFSARIASHGNNQLILTKLFKSGLLGQVVALTVICFDCKSIYKYSC